MVSYTCPYQVLKMTSEHNYHLQSLTCNGVYQGHLRKCLQHHSNMNILQVGKLHTLVHYNYQLSNDLNTYAMGVYQGYLSNCICTHPSIFMSINKPSFYFESPIVIGSLEIETLPIWRLSWLSLFSLLEALLALLQETMKVLNIQYTFIHLYL